MGGVVEALMGGKLINCCLHNFLVLCMFMVVYFFVAQAAALG
jgi:hypothetical protein